MIRIITENEARSINEGAELFPFPHVNATGMAEIRAFLEARHEMGAEHLTESMVSAWADDAEFQMVEGNSPTIELKRWEAVSGHTETYTISDAGIDWAINDD